MGTSISQRRADTALLRVVGIGSCSAAGIETSSPSQIAVRCCKVGFRAGWPRCVQFRACLAAAFALLRKRQKADDEAAANFHLPRCVE